MKILHCIPTMGGGGAERQLAYLSGALVSLGHTVHVALLRGGTFSSTLADGGATVHTLPEHPPWDPRGLTDLARLIRSTEVDLVQTWLTRMDVWGGLAAKITRRPWIHSERFYGVIEQSTPARAVERFLTTATAVVANSETGAARWRTLRGARGGVHMVANALPTEAIDAAIPCTPSELGVPGGAPMVLYVGRFAAQKNIGVLATALGQVLSDRGETVAVCCGDGPDLAGFRRTLDAHGVGARCVTPGFRPDIWSVMKAATVFVSPSLAEGRPNAVHEAMLCGCPMVLSDIPQHREFVPSDAALFFPPDDPSAAAKQIGALLDDRVGAIDRARRARTVAEGFTVRAMALRYEAIYREILGR